MHVFSFVSLAGSFFQVSSCKDNKANTMKASRQLIPGAFSLASHGEGFPIVRWAGWTGWYTLALPSGHLGGSPVGIWSTSESDKT